MKLIRNLTTWFSRRENSTAVAPAAKRMFDLLNEAYLCFQPNKTGKTESLALEALRGHDADTPKNLADYALGLLVSIWLTEESYQKGIDFFTDRIRQNPQEALAYHYRGANLWYSAQQSQALIDYTRALELDPSDLWSLISRG